MARTRELALPRRSQPQGAARLDPSDAIARDVYAAWPTSQHDVGGAAPLTLRGSGAHTTTPHGIGLRAIGGNGADVPLDLSGCTAISLACWLYWDSYANNDAMAFEFTANGAATAGGFFLDPNSGAPMAGYGQIAIGGANANPYAWRYDRPSAATWHHHCVLLDVASMSARLWIDGTAAPLTLIVASGSPASGFANSKLYLFSRNNSELRATGTMVGLTVVKRWLTDDECQSLYRQHWSLYAPVTRRIWLPDAAPSGVPDITAVLAESILSDRVNYRATLNYA